MPFKAKIKLFRDDIEKWNSYLLFISSYEIISLIFFFLLSLWKSTIEYMDRLINLCFLNCGVYSCRVFYCSDHIQWSYAIDLHYLNPIQQEMNECVLPCNNSIILWQFSINMQYFYSTCAFICRRVWQCFKLCEEFSFLKQNILRKYDVDWNKELVWNNARMIWSIM